MAIVHRAQGATGTVLVSSSVDVASDGFVQISARFLLPQTSVPNFAPYSPWPQQSKPSGTPANLQGGPFLISKTIKKENGLVFADCVYVSALHPIKPSIDASINVASFSGYAEDRLGNSQSISFDYYQVVRTYEYATVGQTKMLIPPVAPGLRFNDRTEGKNGLVQIGWKKSTTGSKKETGPVVRWSITSTGTYYQINTDVGVISGAAADSIELLNDYSNADAAYG